MRERRLPVGMIIIAPVAAGLAVYAFTVKGTVPDPSAATVTPTSTAVSFDDPTQIVEEPTAGPPAYPTPPPTAAARGQLRDGVRARVNTPGDCLNARNSPSTQNDWVIVQTCLLHGHEGVIAGPATQSDGHWWWYLAPYGYVAEEYLEYAGDIDLRQAQAPWLAGTGRIAFVRDGDIWLMNADGSDQHVLLDRPDATSGNGPHELHWSPDGTKIAFFAVQETRAGIYEQELQVIDSEAGALLFFRSGYAGIEWSPDSRTISTISSPENSMGGTSGFPTLVDVVTGIERPLWAGERFWMTRPAAFNHDGTKLLLTYAPFDDASQTNESAILVWDTQGRELARIDQSPGESFYYSPKWSPVEDLIAIHVQSPTESGNAVWDFAQGGIIASQAVPARSTKSGGKCGSPDMFRMLWSRDGAHILYDFSDGDTNANGIWAWDVARDRQTLTIASAAGDPSPGPEGRFVFTSWGNGESFIVTGDTNGGYARIITDGSAAAWAP